MGCKRRATTRHPLCVIRRLDRRKPQPLAGLKILDVGCGGGLLSEASTHSAAIDGGGTLVTSSLPDGHALQLLRPIMSNSLPQRAVTEPKITVVLLALPPMLCPASRMFLRDAACSPSQHLFGLAPLIRCRCAPAEPGPHGGQRHRHRRGAGGHGRRGGPRGAGSAGRGPHRLSRGDGGAARRGRCPLDWLPSLQLCVLRCHHLR